MKRQLYLNTCLVLFALLLSLGCSNPKQDWQETEKLGTIEAYEKFLQKYPEGQLADGAKRKIEELKWQETTNINTVEAYDKFLQEYPQGEFNEKAKLNRDLFGIPPEVRLEIEKLISKDPKIRGEGAKRLGQMGTRASAAVPYLVGILGDQEQYTTYQDEVAIWTIRPNVEAEYALRQIGDAAVNPLIAALKHKDPVVREKALSALKDITKKDFGEDSIRWQSWWDKNKKTDE